MIKNVASYDFLDFVAPGPLYDLYLWGNSNKSIFESFGFEMSVLDCVNNLASIENYISQNFLPSMLLG